MQGRGFADTEEVIRELGDGFALEGIAVGGAGVASIVGTAISVGQNRAGVGRGDGGQTGVGERSDTADGFVGAAGADEADEGRVTRELGRSRGAAFGGATSVFGGQEDIVTEQFPALVIDGDLDAAFGVFTEGAIGP